MTPRPDLARRALRLLDLTDLSDAPSDRSTAALCARATSPQGPVAAICLWPQFVSQARRMLEGSPVRIATVANFPGGDEDVERVIDGVQEALSDGADEIDVVLPYRAFLAGDKEAARALIAGVRDMVDGGRTLKVILETGILADPAAIEAASRLAVAEGADFIKTSTGKTPVSATLPAAEIMLGVIRDAPRPVGLKPSGGIRTLDDAAAYLALADRIMGPGWATAATFRFGASGLFDALLAEIEGGTPKSSSAAY
ncbi:deoxyribose-phosphate aldolase [Salinarimonas soli]|uniref:Deoxyribose-phosphate aldolase n=1 Tax=Salinarimonas soli TaxID=1638099 RepID=A0A5B2V9F4_9HYPH|nr:deoxyribose-phosphate aldolase [Salinarimonas soli]KAA2236133.1 deoxyribose-phosphate aldolase [Salinarimonas soli]